jgi:Ca2+:H+ antiporter
LKGHEGKIGFGLAAPGAFLFSTTAVAPTAAPVDRRGKRLPETVEAEAVATRTGDAVGGLLNATLGNLTELIIAITALNAG